jgi:hypothetical protein
MAWIYQLAQEAKVFWFFSSEKNILSWNQAACSGWPPDRPASGRARNTGGSWFR